MLHIEILMKRTVFVRYHMMLEKLSQVFRECESVSSERRFMKEIGSHIRRISLSHYNSNCSSIVVSIFVAADRDDLSHPIELCGIYARVF